MFFIFMSPIIALIGLLTADGDHLPGTSNLTVTVTDMRNNSGMICVSLFGNEGFPKAKEKALRTEYSTILKGTATVTFTNLSPGEYAASVFHDENNNKKLDVNFFGIPREGVGASNDAKGHFGPPAYNDAKFQLSGNALNIVIHITYL